MTLIASLITHDYILQVSDQRLSVGSQFHSDNAVKAILIDQRILVGYTGLARIDGKPTEQWLVEELVTRLQTVQSVPAIQQVSDEAFSRRPQKGQALAFVAACFLRRTTGIAPGIVRISNAMDEHGNWLPTVADKFTRYGQELEPHEPFLLNIAGESKWLYASEDQVLRNLLRKAIKKSVSPNVPVRLLASAIRKVSQRLEDNGRATVGKSLLCTFLPRKAAEATDGRMMQFLAEPSHDCVTSFSIPEGISKGVHQGCFTVSAGMATRGIEVQYGNGEPIALNKLLQSIP